jgi:ATP-dependent helicase HrpA
MVFPGSTLFNKNAAWIVAAEMVKTSRLFARTAAKIDPAWLENLGGSLCSSTYLDPHWDRNRGEVLAYQQVTLYGLVITLEASPMAPSTRESLQICPVRLVEENLMSLFRSSTITADKNASMESKLRRRHAREQRDDRHLLAR